MRYLTNHLVSFVAHEKKRYFSPWMKKGMNSLQCYFNLPKKDNRREGEVLIKIQRPIKNEVALDRNSFEIKTHLSLLCV